MDNPKVGSADLVAFANLEMPEFEKGPLDKALSESLYRTISLVAYGNGNGCFEDVSPFLDIAHHHRQEWDEQLEEERVDDWYTYEIVLPYVRRYLDHPEEGALKIPRHYRNSLNPTDSIRSATRSVVMTQEYQISETEGYEMFESEGFQVFSFDFGISDSEESRRWACNVAGQLIINAHIAPLYTGMYDGKPLFEPNTMDDRLWLAFAELRQHQFPGICAVCGKALNRKRETNGGKPQKTCQSHSNALQNIKKQLRKKAREIGDTSMAYKDICEMAARAQRTTKQGLNERPLTYPGIEILSYACMSMDNSDAKESADDR